MDNISRGRALACLIAVIIVLPISYLFYSSQHNLTQAKASQTTITNEAYLQEILPKSVVETVAKTLVKYGASGTGNTNDYTFTVSSEIRVNSGGYTFYVIPSYGGKPLQVGVSIDNSAGITAVTVFINGVAQPAVV